MVRFSIGREEDDNFEDAASKRRRILAGTFSCSASVAASSAVSDGSESSEDEEEEEIVEEEEEEEEESESESESESEAEPEPAPEPEPEHEPVREENGSVTVMLSDPDVLDCPICLESLSAPVFQCENGHIACSSCCLKIANKCPSCCWPIGYNRCRAIEKVLESVKVSCSNKSYGCKETLSYSKKADHEKACNYAPFSCPYHGCDFVSFSAKVYAHFTDKHGSSAEKIYFNTVHPIYIEKHQNYQILQERSEGIIFIINHSSDRLGSAVNIICIGPSSQKRRFPYKLVATYGESTFKLESIAEITPNWSENSPMKKFLLVPRDVISSGGQLKIDVFLEQRDTGITF